MKKYFDNIGVIEKKCKKYMAYKPATIKKQ